MSHYGRRESVTGVYHVMGRGGNNEKIFNEVREKRQFLKLLHKYLEQYNVFMHAYCIMPNHYHMMVEAKIEELSMFMAKLLAEYARYYNYKHYRQGYVFQSRFKSECIETEGYYWNCIRYIHRNPVKGNLSVTPETYEFSSINEYNLSSEWIITKKAFEFYKKKFGNWHQFLRFHRSVPTIRLKDITSDVWEHLNDWAKMILVQMQEENNLQIPEEVIEIKELREKYQERLKADLKISVPQMKKLYQEVRQELTENRLKMCDTKN